MGLERLQQLSILSWSHLYSKVIVLCYSPVERLFCAPLELNCGISCGVFTTVNALKAKDSNDSLKLPFGSFEVCFLAQLSFGRRQPPTAPEWPHLSPTAPASHPSLSAARWCEPAAPPHTPRLRLSAEGRTKGYHCQSFIFFLHEAFRPHTSSLIFLSRSRKKKKKSQEEKISYVSKSSSCRWWSQHGVPCSSLLQKKAPGVRVHPRSFAGKKLSVPVFIW